jgi:hypothetical protein
MIEIDSLEELFPANFLVIEGESVEVTPFKFGQFAWVLKFIKKYQEIIYTSDRLAYDLLDCGEGALTDIAILVEYSTGKTREWLDQLTAENVLDLIYKIFEVNADFFIQKLNRNSLDLVKKLSSAGQIQQPNSLPTDTDGQTSPATTSDK